MSYLARGNNSSGFANQLSQIDKNAKPKKAGIKQEGNEDEERVEAEKDVNVIRGVLGGVENAAHDADNLYILNFFNIYKYES